ncbi:pyruvate formate lyase-activating protein [Clostridia bacterium]|nr:pyruvate formate lyase-activating protein [Clostridia bacterium]
MSDDAPHGVIFNIQKFSIHDGPGIRTTVFMKGCPLRCLWCANPESQNIQPQQLGNDLDSRSYSVDEVVSVCMQDKLFYEESGGGVTLSGGEPLVQWQFAEVLLAELKARGVHTAIETTGCVPSEVFRKVTQRAELLLFDVKHYEPDKHKAGTGISNELILSNLKYSINSGMKSGVEILLRIPVIPGFNNSLEDAAAFAGLLKEVGAASVQLLPFHQMGDRKYELLGVPYAMKGERPLHTYELTEYRDVFMQNGIQAFF